MVGREEPERILASNEQSRVALEVGEGDELASRSRKLVTGSTTLCSSGERQSSTGYLDEANAERRLPSRTAGCRDGREGLVDRSCAICEMNLLPREGQLVRLAEIRMPHNEMGSQTRLTDVGADDTIHDDVVRVNLLADGLVCSVLNNFGKESHGGRAEDWLHARQEENLQGETCETSAWSTQYLAPSNSPPVGHRMSLLVATATRDCRQPSQERLQLPRLVL